MSYISFCLGSIEELRPQMYSTVRKWFFHFKLSHFSGRPYPRQSTEELASTRMMDCDQSTTSFSWAKLKNLVFVCQRKQKSTRQHVCFFADLPTTSTVFLSQTITYDEKLCLTLTLRTEMNGLTLTEMHLTQLVVVGQRSTKVLLSTNQSSFLRP